MQAATRKGAQRAVKEEVERFQYHQEKAVKKVETKEKIREIKKEIEKKEIIKQEKEETESVSAAAEEQIKHWNEFGKQ